MYLIDTHAHLYLPEYDVDCKEVITRALDKGIERILLPNIDSKHTDLMLNLCQKYPENCFPMMGLHPTYVKQNYKEELFHVEEMLSKHRFVAVGEIGIDLYWSKEFIDLQIDAFKFQIELALKYQLPIVVHARNSMREILDILSDYKDTGLKGVLHCFSGTYQEGIEAIEYGFLLGIGGVITYNKSEQEKIAPHIPLEHIILETDSPYLSPVPHRGKRNESSYLYFVAEKLAKLTHKSIDEIALATTRNAVKLFGF